MQYKDWEALYSQFNAIEYIPYTPNKRVAEAAKEAEDKSED